MVVSRPAILFETGFQLSFSAVAGIAGFQKPLSLWIPAKNWLARRTWQLVTLSLAAQLATAPLSIYYFHKFSNVFILSNLAVIPLATVILYVGLAFILLSAIGLYPLAGILEWLASLLGGITTLMGGIPGALIENISLVPVQVLLLYLAIIPGCLFLRSRRILMLQAMMATAAIFLLVSCIREYRVRKHEGFYVFSIPGESAISLIRGRQHALYRGGRIRGDPRHIPYALRNFCTRNKISAPDPMSLLPDTISVFSSGRHGRSGITHCRFDTSGVQLIFTLFRECRIVILRRWPEKFPGLHADLKADILVIVDHTRCNPETLINVFKPGQIIVDGSSYTRVHVEMERACRQHGIPFHSTEKDGFYVY
jgi:competence protein ComEC